MYQTHDDVVSSLQAILVYYGIHADVRGLAGVYGSPEENASNLHRIAEQVGLEVTQVHVRMQDMDKISHPVFFERAEKKYGVAYPQNSYFSHLISGMQIPGTKEEGESSQSEIITAYAVRPQDSEFQQQKKKPLAWFWNPIKDSKRQYSEIALTAIFINILALAIPLYSMNVYDRVVPNFSQSTLAVLTIGIVLAVAIDFILKVVRSFIIESISSKLSLHYDGELMERFNLIPNWKIQMTVGEKAYLFQELQGVRDYYAARLFPTLIDAPFFVFYLIAIFMICPALTLVPIVFAIIIMLISVTSWALQEGINKQAFMASQKFSSRLYEMLDGVTAARLSNSMGARLHRWKTSLQDTAKIRRKLSFANSLIQNGTNACVYLAQVSVLFFGIYEIHAGNTTVGGLVAISTISSRALTPIVGIGSVFSQYKKSKAFLDSLNKIFSLPHDGEKAGRLGVKGPFKGRIEMRNVTFLYPKAAMPAIVDLDFAINEKEKVGLIGQNGAGKSTLAQLMAGILDPQQGNIFIDQYLYAVISPPELRKTVGFVPQRPFLFEGTIKDNILLGNTDFTQSALDEAIHVAGLERMVSESGFGLETEVGEDGAYLSAGQKQALSLARALIHQPRLLILDEPTSGMDHALEQHLLRTLRVYLQDKTFVMVTHRTPLLPLVDRLVLIEKGRIKADGTTHAMLKSLEAGGVRG